MENYTNFYDKRPEQRENNIFTEEFFSGTDVDIYIDGKKVESIAYIGYTVQEQQKPIYGYASRTFDDVAVGSRVVVGTIRVPIANPNENPLIKSIEEDKNSYYDILDQNKDTKTDIPTWALNAKKGK